VDPRASLWTGVENPAVPGFDPQSVQLIMSRYTDYTLPATLIYFQIPPTQLAANDCVHVLY
jgi:hypothetical protein